MNNTISIIIVNFNTPDLTIRCIKSIPIKENIEIIVVDNDSKDNSVHLILNQCPHVKIIRSTYNSGFGRANNLGVANSSGKFILFLNSDMILEINTLNVCSEILFKDDNIGVLGCKLINEDGSDQKSVYYNVGEFKNVLKDNLFYNYFFYKIPIDIQGIMGSFMLLKKDVFHSVGGFDPDFFMYAEELELCKRIKKLGLEIKFTNETKAIHKHGGSSSNKTWSTRQNLISNSLLYLKTKGVTGYLSYHLICHINALTNFILMWKLDKKYREDYWVFQRNYFSNYIYYIQIPFLYSKKIGNGKRFLRRG